MSFADSLFRALGFRRTVGVLDRFDINGDGSVGPLDALCVMRDNAGLPGTAFCPSPLVHARIVATGVDPALLPTCILSQVAKLPLPPGCG